MRLQVRTFVYAGALVLAALGVFTLHGQDAPRQATGRDERMLNKLQELRTAAKELVDMRRGEFTSGRISYQDVFQAQRQLFDVELRLARTNSERSKVLTEHLQAARDAERTIAASVEAGVQARSALVESQIARLKVEVAVMELTP